MMMDVIRFVLSMEKDVQSVADGQLSVMNMLDTRGVCMCLGGFRNEAQG